ncbi:MAG: TonB-dependent receptor [Candidatus Zixiibacteriota bacterium]|nr:MAG: TonB-dependent receptor [candidate division Zixibacteria bacterium]
MKLKLLCVTCTLVLLLTGTVFSAVVGKITGVITDAETQQPIVGVTVAVQGTNWGAITDVDGRYNILNVPVSTYTLVISAVGYATVEISNVDVHADLASYQNQALSPEAAELGTVIQVTAEAPLVVQDKTAAINIIKQEEIQALPTRGFEQVVGIQNSVVRVQFNPVVAVRGGREASQTGELNLRGGRRSEVAYYVDGFSQQDPLSGLSTANIANNAIQEVSVIAGGFPAEYGHVSSGIVNTITSSGGADFSGSVEAVSDFIADKSYDQNWYSANFGGPLPGLENSSFFGSVERRWHGDRQPSAITEDVFPTDPGREQERLPKNTLEGWSWQGKLNFGLTPNFKVELSTNGSQDKWFEYQHNYLFNQEHAPWYKDDNIGINGKITHTLNSKTYYNVSASYFMTERFRGDGLYKEDLLAYHVPGGNPRFGPTALFWLDGHVWDDFLRRKSSYIGFKGDINTQPTPEHTLKLGFDFQRHTLRYYNHLFPAKLLDPAGFNDIDRYGYDSLANEVDSDADGRNAAKHPINWATYVQDRFEWRGLIVNAGLRFDYFDYKSDRLRNPARPLDPDTLEDANSFILDEGDLEDSEKFTRLSPRLGLAFPVSDRTQMRLNYGKFFQRPDLVRLYVGDSYMQHKFNLGGYYYSFGNPNLEPEKTTQYEVGMTHALSDNAVFDVAAYYKDVDDLVQVYSQAAFPNSYGTYRNSDYGTIKGLEFAFTLRRTRNIYLNVKYTLTYATGTGSFATTQANIAWQSTDEPKQNAPLDFDQRHNLVGNFDWRTGENGGPRLGEIHPLENFGVNVLVTAASGLPYSPSEVYNEVTLAASAPTAEAPRNSNYGPWTFSIDLKAEKTFNVSGYKIVPFVWVKNLLDRDNALTVYESTGRPNTTNWLASEPGLEFLDTYGEVQEETGLAGEEMYNLKEANPQNYSNPRQIFVGLRVAF